MRSSIFLSALVITDAIAKLSVQLTSKPIIVYSGYVIGWFVIFFMLFLIMDIFEFINKLIENN